MFTANLPSLLRVIAELRVQGIAWSIIAEQVALSEAELHPLLRQEYDAYQREYQHAKSELLEEVFVEAVAKMREQLSCGDAKLEAAAAKTLLRVCDSQERLRHKAEAANKKQTDEPEHATTMPVVVPVVTESTLAEPTVATTATESEPEETPATPPKKWHLPLFRRRPTTEMAPKCENPTTQVPSTFSSA